MWPLRGLVAPSGIFGAPSGILYTSLEIRCAPSEILCAPSDFYSTPSGIRCTPSETLCAPSEILCALSEIRCAPYLHTGLLCTQSQSFLPDLFPPQSHRRPELGLTAVNFKPKALILQLTKPRLKEVPYFTEAHTASFLTSTSSDSHTLTLHLGVMGVFTQWNSASTHEVKALVFPESRFASMLEIAYAKQKRNMGERQQVLLFVHSLKPYSLSIPPPCIFSSPIGLGYLHLHAHWSPPSGRLITGCMPLPFSSPRSSLFLHRAFSVSRTCSVSWPLSYTCTHSVLGTSFSPLISHVPALPHHAEHDLLKA